MGVPISMLLTLSPFVSEKECGETDLLLLVLLAKPSTLKAPGVAFEIADLEKNWD